MPAAFAGIHGTHQHKFSGVSHSANHTGDRHFSVLQGLPHHIQGVLAEFRQFIQKQHALVGHGDLTRLGIAAATGKTGIGNGMVRTAEGALGHQRFFGCQKAHNGIDLTNFQGFFPGHIRKDSRQALGEHTFTGAGRADQQHIVAACSRNLQGTLHIFLAHHILEIRDGKFLSLGHPNGFLRQGNLTIESSSKFLHIVDAIDRRATGQGGFGGILCRHKQDLDACFFSSQGHRQHTVYRTQCTLQAHLTDECGAAFGTTNRAGSRHDAQQNRQVIVGASLLQVGRGKIDGDAAGGKAEAGILRRGTDTLTGFLHGSIRKAHNIKAGQAVGNIALGYHFTALNTGNTQGMYTADHIFAPFLPF